MIEQRDHGRKTAGNGRKRGLWKGKRIRVLGSRLFYRDEGHGPPVLLLHGWTGNSYQWRRMLPGLARTHRVIAPDLPGCGRSEKPPLDYRIADYLLYLREFANELRLGRFTVIGTSFGGFIAVRYCLAFPEDVGSLILLNASGIQKPYHHWLFRACALPVVGYAVTCLALLPRDLKHRMRAKLFPRTAIHRQRFREFRYATLTLRSWKGLRAAVRANANVTPKDLVDGRLAEIRCPTLIVWGTQDEALPGELAEVFHRNITGSRLRMIPGCGHNIPEERPAEVLDEIRAFFNDSPL
jgi:pimeloyl-ACP methyl ester carboxylesterase